ncbi:hypothetical protein GPECTOR_8g62 [Gonium pectorale]|uniref:gamma-glutamylcyclotransferase n=1 Tax=Gonium pectorale TaxID=33097 RepID=A0A150GT89_GONPE|nr:hypothetical protein GPECTOR_8g62 [Gonium pectorale]|eukprot:KXZ53069.1 hypothetical protein GPECTOR_8g62 [Gonium pectorale]
MGWTLSFRMLGLPYAEPGFATIERAQPEQQQQQQQQPGPVSTGASSSGSSRWRSEVHGVVHLLRHSDWVQVMATEGVGAGSTGYRVVEVEVELYDGRRTKALTLEGQGASLHRPDRPVAPSRRYLELLRAGARHHGLDPEYVSYLDSLVPYEGSGWGTGVGRAAALAVALPLALPLIPPVLYLRMARKKRQEDAQRASGADGAAAASNTNGPVAAASAAASAARDAADLPSKAAAAAAAPLAPSQAEAAVAGVKAADVATATAASAPGGPLPPELLQPPLVLPSVLSGYLAAVQYTTWAVHDLVGAPLLGSGSAAAGGGVKGDSSGGGVGGKRS